MQPAIPSERLMQHCCRAAEREGSMFSSLIGFASREVTKTDRDPWATEPVVVRRLVTAPRELLSMVDLAGLLNRTGDNPLVATVVLNHRVVPQHQYPDRNSLNAFLNRGATVTFAALQRRLPTIRAVCDQLQTATHVPSFATAYLTPVNSQGFEAHWDLGSVTVTQTIGTKTWELRRPVITTDAELAVPYSARPNSVNGFRKGELDGPPFLTVTLKPGDTLFVPRAWVHSARATNEESLHVSFGSLHRGIDLAACYTVYP